MIISCYLLVHKNSFTQGDDKNTIVGLLRIWRQKQLVLIFSAAIPKNCCQESTFVSVRESECVCE